MPYRIELKGTFNFLIMSQARTPRGGWRAEDSPYSRADRARGGLAAALFLPNYQF